MITFELTVPNVNTKWWQDSKTELLNVVKQHHQESWSAQQDPATGKAWAPRKKPTGSWPILRKSGRMLGSAAFKADHHPMLFKATTNVGYGKYHQEGTSKMPQRRWLGLGAGFSKKFAAVVAKHMFKGYTVYST